MAEAAIAVAEAIVEETGVAEAATGHAEEDTAGTAAATGEAAEEGGIPHGEMQQL